MCREYSADRRIKPIRFAVASKTGLNIDQHFGHVTEFYIFDYINKDVKFVEKRRVDKFCTGIEECDDSYENRIDKIIKTIGDCFAVLVSRIGDEPKEKLERRNIKVYQSHDEIKNAIRKVVSEIVV